MGSTPTVRRRARAHPEVRSRRGVCVLVVCPAAVKTSAPPRIGPLKEPSSAVSTSAVRTSPTSTRYSCAARSAVIQQSRPVPAPPWRLLSPPCPSCWVVERRAHAALASTSCSRLVGLDPALHRDRYPPALRRQRQRCRRIARCFRRRPARVAHGRVWRGLDPIARDQTRTVPAMQGLPRRSCSSPMTSTRPLRLWRPYRGRNGRVLEQYAA